MYEEENAKYILNLNCGGSQTQADIFRTSDPYTEDGWLHQVTPENNSPTHVKTAHASLRHHASKKRKTRNENRPRCVNQRAQLASHCCHLVQAPVGDHPRGRTFPQHSNSSSRPPETTTFLENCLFSRIYLIVLLLTPAQNS